MKRSIVLERADDTPFELLEDRRVMVSLGPVSETLHCVYDCPFCYVGNGFLSYANMDVQDIVTWILELDQKAFDIIYISGDTDSFAPPRTSKGLELLDALSVLQKDVLFTTRTVFSETELDTLHGIVEKYSRSGNLVFGCVSICQWSKPNIESLALPSPEQRVNQLKRFSEIEINSVLAMRPFLPTVPINDYTTILEKSAQYVCLVLGDNWFHDTTGNMERRLLGSEGLPLEDCTIAKMNFDSNTEDWKVYSRPEVIDYCTNWCREHSVPFAMKSKSIIDQLRSKKNGQR